MVFPATLYFILCTVQHIGTFITTIYFELTLPYPIIYFIAFLHPIFIVDWLMFFLTDNVGLIACIQSMFVNDELKGLCHQFESAKSGFTAYMMNVGRK